MKRVHERDTEKRPKKFCRELRALLEPQIEQICLEIMPTCRPRVHLLAFFNSLNADDLPRIDYERMFIRYTMIHLYEKNITDALTVCKVIAAFPFRTQYVHRTRIGLIYRTPHSVRWPAETFPELVAETVFFAHYGFLTFLIKYGKCDFPTNDFSLLAITWLRHFANVMFLHWDELIRIDFGGFDLDHETRKRFKKEIRKLSRKVNMSYRRLVLTMLVIDVAVEHKKATRSFDATMCMRKARCIDLITRTTTEPRIALEDVAEVTRFSQIQHTTPIVEDLKSHLLKLFPDMPDCRHVRSLCDLCRSRIRQSLRSDQVLINQVMDLQLPRCIRNFVLFENSDFAQIMREDFKYTYSNAF